MLAGRPWFWELVKTAAKATAKAAIVAAVAEGGRELARVVVDRVLYPPAPTARRGSRSAAPTYGAFPDHYREIWTGHGITFEADEKGRPAAEGVLYEGRVCKVIAVCRCDHGLGAATGGIAHGEGEAEGLGG